MKGKLKLINDWLNSGQQVSTRWLAIMLIFSMALAALLAALELHFRHL